MKNAAGFAAAIDQLAEPFQTKAIDIVLGIEARGFIFASTLAYKLGAGFVPVRKTGKLPAATHRASYDLEYGKDTLEIHQDAIQPGSNVLIADDLMATGGTAAAVAAMVKQMGGNLVGLAFLVELEFLHGRDKLQGMDIFSLIKY
jgi:adenine phosphoribosyltransferase